MQLTYKEQYIFDVIQTSHHSFLQEIEKKEYETVADAMPRIEAYFLNVMAEIEIANAKEILLFSKNETNSDDALLINLKRLFCSGQKNDFVLAKQILLGLVLSEKALLKLIKYVYHFYMHSNINRFFLLYLHQFVPNLARVRGIEHILEMQTTTEADKRIFTEYKLTYQKSIVHLFCLGMIGDEEVSSRWLV
jgi:hypothetical protein